MTNNLFNLFDMFEDNTDPSKETTTQQEGTNTTEETVSTPVQPIEAVEAVENDCIGVEVSEDATDAKNELVEQDTEEQEADMDNAFEALSKQADAADAEMNIKADAATKANATKGKTDKKSAPAEDEFKLNDFTVIRYYREEIPVTDYFTTSEIAEGIEIKKKDSTIERKPIDGEIVRGRLEKDFPEFVKGYTEMKYFGKDKNFILPVVVAKKKGNTEVSCL